MPDDVQPIILSTLQIVSENVVLMALSAVSAAIHAISRRCMSWRGLATSAV